MDLGQEILRDKCPEKYCSKNSFFSDILPILLASVVVAIMSGTMFNKAGINIFTTVVMDVLVIMFLCGLFLVLFSGVKKRLAQTYISVCEKGICGIRAINGYKNGMFEIVYADILKVTNKGERVIIETKIGKIIMTLSKAEETVNLIKEKCETVKHG